jgi:hypothetical protein
VCTSRGARTNHLRGGIQNEVVGETSLVDEIKIPVDREPSDRWSVLYRPSENIIWIYESGTKKLFKYKGFDVDTDTTLRA